MENLGAQPGKARVLEANAASEPRAKGLMLHLLVVEGTPAGPSGLLAQSPLCGLETAVHHTMSCLALGKPLRLLCAACLLHEDINNGVLSSFLRLSYQVTTHLMV